MDFSFIQLLAKSIPFLFFYNLLKLQRNSKIQSLFLRLKLPIFLTVAYFYVQSLKTISEFGMRIADYEVE
jgi:hypothetical protein